jgi:hypothetical protein
VDYLFGSDAELANFENRHTNKKALHVQNLTLQFISETGSTHGPRVYHRSAHTQQCIRRMNRPKTKRTRARPLKVKPIGPLSWEVRTHSSHDTRRGGRKHQFVKWSKHAIPRHIPQSSTRRNTEPPRRTSTSSIATESGESLASLLERLNSISDESQLVPASPSPLSIVGQGTRDHLSSYPIACTDFDHGVIDHCTSFSLFFDFERYLTHFRSEMEVHIRIP